MATGDSSTGLQFLLGGSNQVPAELAIKYETNASSYWDKFYRRNEDRFYKDRHYFDREWPELLASGLTVLEVGCGVGNSIWPMLEFNPSMRLYACDFSSVAIGIVKANPAYASGRVHAFVADLTETDMLAHVPAGSVDVVTMVFVLSAVAPEKMGAAIANVARVLKPGSGTLLFRDYAQGDLAMDRLQNNGVKRLGDNYYVRGDGTRCYYFTEQVLRDLFAQHGLRCSRMHMHEREKENRKRQIVMQRRWLQATFVNGDNALGAHPAATSPQPSGSSQAQPQVQAQQQTPSTPSTSKRHEEEAGGQQFSSGSSWLVGAAGRLVSHLEDGPGRPNLRALLPDSLDPADQLVTELAAQRAASGGSAGAAGRKGAGGGTPISGLQDGRASRARHLAAEEEAMMAAAAATAAAAGCGTPRTPTALEAEVEASFWETINRSTEDVVAEELASAGIAAIRLADPTDLLASTSAAATVVASGSQQMQGQGQGQGQQGQGSCLRGSSGGGAREAMQVDSAPSCPPAAQQAQQAQHEWESGDDGVLGSDLGCLFGAGCSQQYSEEDVEVSPGVSFRVRCLSREYRHTNSHTGLMAWEAAPYLARLLAACPGLTLGKTVLEVGAGGSGLVAMSALRWARRVCATDGSAAALDLLAANLRLNAARVVVERVKLAPLVWGSAEHVGPLQRAFPQGFEVVLGADVVYSPESVRQLFPTVAQLMSRSPTARLLLVHFIRQVSEEQILAAAHAAGLETEECSTELRTAADVAGISQTSCRVVVMRMRQA